MNSDLEKELRETQIQNDKIIKQRNELQKMLDEALAELKKLKKLK